MFVTSVYCSCTMKRSWTCLMEPEIQRVGTGSQTLRSMRTPAAASTPLESLPDWCTQRRRWVHVCVCVGDGGLFISVHHVFQSSYSSPNVSWS